MKTLNQHDHFRLPCLFRDYGMRSLRTFVVVIACISFIGLNARAADKIQGAFGKNLGETFDPSSAITTSKMGDGTTMYEFSPTTGFRSFHNYYLLITPTSHRIYGILGTGRVQNLEAGEKEQAVIMSILQKKYGNESDPGLLGSMSTQRRIDEGKRYIITQITGFSEILLEIQYYDTDLQKLAETERIAAETKKADSSGL